MLTFRTIHEGSTTKETFPSFGETSRTERDTLEVPGNASPPPSNKFIARRKTGLADLSTRAGSTTTPYRTLAPPTSPQNLASSPSSPSSPPPPSASLSARKPRRTTTPGGFRASSSAFSATPIPFSSPSASSSSLLSTDVGRSVTPARMSHPLALVEDKDATDLTSSTSLANEDPLLCCVTVFGIPRDRASIVLTHFHRFGPIVNTSLGSGNWVVVEFASPTVADRALSSHGAIVEGVMIGVKRTEPHDMPQEALSELYRRFTDSKLSQSLVSSTSSSLSSSSTPFTPFKSPSTGPSRSVSSRRSLEAAPLSIYEEQRTPTMRRRKNICERILQYLTVW